MAKLLASFMHDRKTVFEATQSRAYRLATQELDICWHHLHETSYEVRVDIAVWVKIRQQERRTRVSARCPSVTR